MNKSLPNRPFNVTQFSWVRFVSRAINSARADNVCNDVPMSAFDHMRAILIDDYPDPLLLEVADELRIIKSAIRAGAIISNRIADEKDGQRRIRALHVIVDDLLERIETGGNPNAVKPVG